MDLALIYLLKKKLSVNYKIYQFALNLLAGLSKTLGKKKNIIFFLIFSGCICCCDMQGNDDGIIR